MKTKTQVKTERRASRHNRIRARVIGSNTKPRLAVYKSNTAVYAQLIDDATSTTLAAGDTRKQKGDTLLERANSLGKAVAALAKEKGVTEGVFDRGGFRYQGAIAAVADGARSEGMNI